MARPPFCFQGVDLTANIHSDVMSTLNLHDVQGLVKRGYDNLPFSNILLLQVTEKQKAKQWLRNLLPLISKASVKDRELEINIAFTYQGFSRLGLTPLLRTPFSREFEEGMADESRSRLLGDYDPTTNQTTVGGWDWRDTEGSNAVHVMLLLYGLKEDLVETYCSELKLCYVDNGISEIKKLVTLRLAERREHFGFRDGISQPFIQDFASLEKEQTSSNTLENTIALGEFLLGYPNQYGKVTEVPTADKDGKAWPFGHNGTYLVMRQLEQAVKEFWHFMEEQSRNADGSSNMQAGIALAAKMVGRWPNGTPLVCSPRFDDPRFAEKNDFLFAFGKGEKFRDCPYGAHIARVNPRDSLDKDSATSFETVNHHRLLRRGRSYGRPFITSMEPDELFRKANNESEERGLHFICLNANISRQFEFVQSTWINNRKFQGLYNDADQISGTQVSDFTVHQRPVAQNIKNIPSFVKVKGGGYFFMPSHTALQYLVEC